ESLVRGGPLRHDDAPGLERGVLLEDDVGGPVEDLNERALATPPTAPHVFEEIVANCDSPDRLTWMIVVAAEDVDRRTGVADDVVGEGDVFDRRPRRP